jgi:putative glutamine amidotransferase
MGAHPFHMVGEKYILGARDGAGTLPLLLPVLVPPLDFDAVLEMADGILLTGSASNVAPRRYGGPEPREAKLLDERRDETTLALIRAALAHGVPLLAICRGFQELNVALGGTLHQHVHELEGRIDHRADTKAELDVQYGPSHDVDVVAQSPLAAITGIRQFKVNSLHSQGLDRLAPGLRAAAHAPDGTIEAVTVYHAKSFALGVQWHPEWDFRDNKISHAILAAFGEACARRKSTR